jgi:hypothetical protein
MAALLLASGDSRAQAPAVETGVDCAGAFNEAGALRERHSLKEARARYQACALPACPSFVTLCVNLAQEVSASIPSLVFQATDTRGSPVMAVAVTMDGAPFAASLDGIAVEVDPPGKHSFLFRAEGYEPATKDVVVLEGKKAQVETVTLQPVVALAPPAAPVSAPPPAPLPPRAVEPGAAPDRGQAQKTLALVAGGLSVAGLVAGSISGAIAGSTWSSAKRECSPGSCGAGSQAQKDRDAALGSAALSDAFFVAGGVAALGGALLWLTAPAGRPTGTGLRLGPTVNPGGAGLGVAGAF